jgi:hypothetical protein
MATKTEAEILEAHKTTIEALTGKKCVITLIDPTDQVLKWLTLDEIETVVQQYNVSKNATLRTNYGDERLTDLKKIFTLIASRAGFSAKKIGEHLQHPNHTLSLYNLREAKRLVGRQENFKNLYETILNNIIEQNRYLLQK